MRHDHDQYYEKICSLTYWPYYSLLIYTIMVLYLLDGGHRLGCGLLAQYPVIWHIGTVRIEWTPVAEFSSHIDSY